MSHPPLQVYRRRTAGQARGRVLEIGIGTGSNLPYYGADVDEVVGLDPSPHLLSRARATARSLPLGVELVEGSAEALPFEPSSFDTALCTFTLCSVGDPVRALTEVRRVLRPGGRLLFAEHGRAPEAAVARWQDRLTPAWRLLSGGCHLNRAPADLVRGVGFRLEHVTTGYMQGPKAFTFMTEGIALPEPALRALPS